MEFRSTCAAISVAASLWFTTPAHAITYDIFRTIGAGTVDGVIETDGTFGVLSAANILSWEFTLTAPNLSGGSPDFISSANPGATTLVSGSALTASATSLFFDFDDPDPIGVFFRDGAFGANYWCLAAGLPCQNGPISAESIGTNGVGASEAQVAVRSGNLSVGSAAVIPLPASLSMLLAGVAGFAVFRRTRAPA